MEQKSITEENLESIALDSIEAAKYPIIFVPFFDTPVPIMVQELTQAQIVACGDFSTIETFADKIDKKQIKTVSQMLDYAESNHEIVRRALIKPTYEQIIKKISGKTCIEAREKLEELEEKIKDMPKGPKRSALKTEIDSMRIWTDLILPEDFTSTIVSYALGIDKSDIKEISEKILLEAAMLAERGSDNPADHIDGRFTPFMRDDINKRAWILLNKHREDNRRGG